MEGLTSRPFVGRARELGELQAAVDRALDGHGSLWLLGGEPGIGKTRLATEVAAAAARGGVPVLWGRCWEGGGAPTFWPWIQIVRAYARGRPASALPLELGEAVPELAYVLGRPAQPAPEESGALERDPEQSRALLFDAITRLLKDAATPSGLLLLLDDLHAADPLSLLLLRFVAAELDDSRLAVLGTYRDVDAKRAPQVARVLFDIDEARRLPLLGLNEDEVHRLVQTRVGRDGAAASAGAVYRLSEGNPFFIDELLSGLDAGGLPASLRNLPSGVREMVRQRFGTLPAQDYEILSVAAVAGREFDLGVLRAVCRSSEQEIAGVLDRALAERIVERIAADRDEYRFAHGLFREVLYDDLPFSLRLALHAQVGEALERKSDAEPAELAHHFVQAAAGTTAVLDKAVRYATRAADAALTALAYEDAALHYERALQLVELQPDPDRTNRCELLLGLGTSQGKSGNQAKARDTFLRAAAVARANGSAEQLARAALRMELEGMMLEAFESGTIGGVDEPFLALLEEALAGLPAQDGVLRAKLLGRIAVALYWSAGSFERRDALSRHAVEMAERVGDPTALASVLNNRRFALLGSDNFEGRMAASREMLRLAQAAGRREEILAARMWIVLDRLELGDIAGADDELEQMRSLANALRQPFYLWSVALIDGLRALMQGRFDEGESIAQRALRMGQRAQNKLAPILFGGQMFRVWWERGRLADLEAGIEALFGQIGLMPAARCGLAFVLAEIGKLDEARAHFAELSADDFAAIPRDRSWLFGLTLLVPVCAALGETRSAEVLHRLLEPFAKRLIVLGPPPVACWGPVDHYLGMAAAAAGHYADADRHFAEAIELARTIGSPTFQAHSELERARARLRRAEPGDRAAAGELLEHASRAAQALSMEGLAGKAARLAAEIAAAESHPQAPRSGNRFVRVGATWQLAYEGTSFVLPDSKGLAYLWQLMQSQGDDVSVRDLSGFPADAPATRGALAARRLESLRTELEEARRWNDVGRCERIRDEIDRLTERALQRYGAGGSDRPGEIDRIRKAVTGRIREAIKRIRRDSEALARHLDNSVRTGALCCYRPDKPIAWDL